MRTRNPIVLLAVGALALAACDKLSAKDEPSSVPGQPVTNTNATIASEKLDPIAQAGNASSVKRYPDEAKLAPASKLLLGMTTVRTMPEGSEVVAVIGRNVDVTEFAKDHDYYLVLFPDPNDSSRKLAGWVYKDAVESSTGKAIARTPGITCKAGEVGVVAADHEFCATPCSVDGDCANAGGVCDGSGQIASGTLALSGGAYCVGGQGHERR
jgi:hypothetical protein